MSLINRSIPNLIGGVSQQPEILRLDNQASEQLNGISNVVEGLKKRPPCKAIAKLTNSSITNAFIHTINRDVNERYIVVITNGAISVFDIDGNNKQVVDTGASQYLQSNNSREDFVCLTVNDYTYILNKSQTVSMDNSTLSPAKIEQAVYSVKVGVGNDTTSIPYSIKIDGITYTYTSFTSNSKTIRDGLITAIGSISGITISALGDSSITFVKSSGTLNISSSDGYGDQASQLIKDEVQQFADLPAIGINNMVVEVKGTAANSFINYYVKFKSDTSVWEETIAPGIKTSLDYYTMPILLIRTANGNFRLTEADGSNYTIFGTTYSVPEWGTRVVGDEDSSPVPSFVGTKIRDMFFHRNRLGFLADENVIMTRNGEFFEFFNQTVTDSLDTDVIDINVSHSKVSILNHAVAFDEKLILFSDQTQFVLQGGASLTPNNVNVTVTTEFENSKEIKPVGSGTNIFFGFKKGKFSGVREMYVEADGETNQGEDITANVPKYIPNNLFKFANASNENILVSISSNPAYSNSIYVYQWFVSEGRRLQSAWHRWTIGDLYTGSPGDSQIFMSQPPTGTQILNVDFIGTDLFIITNRGSDGVYLEVMDCAPGAVDDGADFLTYLDRKIDSDAYPSMAVYNNVTKQTTITLPYSIFIPVAGSSESFSLSYDIKVISKGYVGSPGVNYPVLSKTTNTVTVSGDITNEGFYIGVPYAFRYRFSQQYLALGQTTSGSGSRTRIREGRLQIRNWTVSYDNTGHFKVGVTPLARDTSIHTFTGLILGSNTSGTVNLEDGYFNFAIQSRNENLIVELFNDTYLPSNFVNAEWEGYYVSQSRSN
jgi:hypothetical protein